MAQDVILNVKNLVTSFDTELGSARAVDGVSFSVRKGQTLGIVGESGCGKTVTSLSIVRLLPKPAAHIEQGEINFDGMDLAKLKAEELHKIRGNRISMIFQEPMSALNPVHRIGKQIGEAFRLHEPGISEKDSFRRCVDLMKKVGIPAPERRIHDFPHQLSGGMRQRVVIAIALACDPDILIADEPTTALDVTIQAQILELIQDLQKESGMAVIFITHDLGVIAEICDEVIVMYGGKIVEQASVEELFARPKHPYTKGLLNSIPRLESVPKSKLNTIQGMVPSLFEMPPGCRFQNRCPYVTAICRSTAPELEKVTDNHWTRCFQWKSIDG